MGEADGLTRREAERAFRRVQNAEERHPAPIAVRAKTVNDATDALRHALALRGCSRSHLANTERMQRLHIGPALGERRLDKVTRGDVEALGERLLAYGRSPKTVRDVITFLHQIYEHAIDLEWTSANPVRRATRPKRRRADDANPDIQFLTLEELEAVIRAIPDEVVMREPKPFRVGRAGPSPPPPPDVLGPVLRVLVRTAAMTGLCGRVSCSVSDGGTLTGAPSASAYARRGPAASSPVPASPTSRRVVWAGTDPRTRYAVRQAA